MFTIPPTDGSGFMSIAGSGNCAVTDRRADATSASTSTKSGTQAKSNPAAPSQTRLYKVDVVLVGGDPAGGKEPSASRRIAGTSPPPSGFVACCRSTKTSQLQRGRAVDAPDAVRPP